MFPGEGGIKKNPRCIEQRGFFVGGLHAKTKTTRNRSYLGMNRCRCQKPPASGGWRFRGKLFSGSGFAGTQIAGRCFGSAGAAIAGSGTAQPSVAVMCDAGSVVPPTTVISRAMRAGWIIVTGSSGIAAAAA